ncbi:putative AP-2 complex subunit mu superfamily protein [Dioscorea sansibarensis]
MQLCKLPVPLVGDARVLYIRTMRHCRKCQPSNVFKRECSTCDVTGKILVKCFLSGMPDLKLGLNYKIGLEKKSELKSRPAKG